MAVRLVADKTRRLEQHSADNDRSVPQTDVGFRVVDLFAGAGGLSEGFRQAGFKIVGGSDIDPDAAATFQLNFADADFVTGDIRTKRVRSNIMDIASAADVLVGGPPCQAFSQVRNHSRLIDDPRNSLYREFTQVIRRTRPPIFVMENVTGIDQMGVRSEIAEDLSIDGEYIVSPQIVDAADFGVPQSRKRLLFVGTLRKLRIPPILLEGTGATDAATLVRFTGTRRPKYQVVVQQNLFSIQLGEALADPESCKVVSAADALSDLSSLKVGNRTDELPYHSIGKPESRYQREMRNGAGELIANVQVPRLNKDTELRLRGIPHGGNHRDLTDSLLDRYITGKRWGQDNGTGKLSRRHFYAYRRLHPSIWAWTLNTKADSVYHYDQPRALSVREFARLQSFPDRFVFTTDARSGQIPGRHDGGPAHSRYRQVGNAVPPLLARSLALRLKVELSKISPKKLATRGA